jgi:hypothetical protein
METRVKTGFCIEVHILDACKLAAHSSKDKEFVRQHLIEKMIDDIILTERIGYLW